MAVTAKNSGLVGSQAATPPKQQPASGYTQFGDGHGTFAGFNGNSFTLPGYASGQQLAGNTSNDAYRGNLQTDFQNEFSNPGGTIMNYGNDSDSDVRQAQMLTTILGRGTHGLDQGMDQVATSAQLDAVKARIGLKNSLGQSIGTNASREGEAEDVLRGDVNASMGEGVKHTTQNFNDRGLLYSGMRESGVNKVKAGAASQLSSGLSDTRREYANLKEQQQQAYATIGMQQQQENIQRANQTFDVVSQNNIARQQATQQLAGGIGQIAGMASKYGAQIYQNSQNGTKPWTSPTGQNTSDPSSYGSVNSGNFMQPGLLGGTP